MPHHITFHKLAKFLLTVLAALIVALPLSDCSSSQSVGSRPRSSIHAPRKSSKKNSAKKNSKKKKSKNKSNSHKSKINTKSNTPSKNPVASKPLPKADYEQMRRHAAKFTYGDTEVAGIIGEAARWIGTPYRFGGTESSGVDCSGLMVCVFGNASGRKLPRNSQAQQQWCQPISRDALRPGDLVFFATGSDRSRVTHVGLYIGNDEIIHASTSSGVIISQLQLPYFTQRYHSAGRPPFLSGHAPAPLLPAPSNGLVEPSGQFPSIDLDILIDEKVDSIFLDLFN